MIRKQSIKFQISPMKDVKGVAGTRSDVQYRRMDGWNDGWTDGWMDTHGWTRVISIVPLRLCRVTTVYLSLELIFMNPNT